MSQLLVHAASQARIDSFLQAPGQGILLAGSTGIGKTYVASSMAAQLLGVEQAALVNEARFRRLTPEKNVIPITAIRALLGFFRLRVPGNADTNRVIVVEDADTMTAEAQNAFLKLLEEPPVGTVLLLTSSRPEHLLQTIRSRVPLLSIQDPEKDDILAYFSAKDLAVGDVERAYALSGGNIAAMQMMLYMISDDKPVLALVREVLAASVYERLLYIDVLTKDRGQVVAFCETLSHVAAATLERTAKQGGQNIQRWHGILKAANTAGEALVRNGNAKLVLTDLLLSL